MIPDDARPSTSAMSAHVRFSDRNAVIDVLRHLGVATAPPVPVWPPRRLPYGHFVSPVRNGWVSVWSSLSGTAEWLAPLTATLECAGVLLEVDESVYWSAEFYRDGALASRVELPTWLVQRDILFAHAEAAGIDAPWDLDPDDPRLGEIEDSPAFREDLEALAASRPRPEDLQPFLPPHASARQAWELLFAIDHPDAEARFSATEEPYAEDSLDAFASYLGIRDATWDPRADAEALTDGDYEEGEGLPEDWRDFVILPASQLPVL